MGAQSQQSQGGSSVFGVNVGVDRQLADRALRALLKHHESSSDNEHSLLGNDLDVQVQFALARIPGNAGPKPVRIDIPHPLVKVAAGSSDGDDNDDAMDDGTDDHLQDVEACIIVKEESKEWVQDMVSRFPAQLGSVKKVLGLQSLRTKHKDFAQRRKLLERFDVFFADDRILPMLTKALGGKFFEKKKQPIPVRLTRKEALPFAVQRCLRSTFMYLSAGTCITVKAGSTAMPPSKLLANVEAICSAVPAKVPRKWSNVCSISIKTSASVALPIYNKTPQELERIMMLAKEEVKEGDVKNFEAGDGEKEIKKRKVAATTPLAKALKKQKAAEEVEVDGKADESSTKSSKKKKKRKAATDDDGAANVEATVTEAKGAAKTPKSSKKKKKKDSIDGKEADKIEDVAPEEVKLSKSARKKRKQSVADSTDGEVLAAKETKTPKSSKKKEKEDPIAIVGEVAMETKKPKSSKKKQKKNLTEEEASEKKGLSSKTPKSSKKKQRADESAEGDDAAASSKKTPKKKGAKESPTEDAAFVPSRKFSGAKKGYVFRKDKLGVGYYKDVLPALDKAWLAGLGKKSSAGTKSAGSSASKRKKGGRSGRTNF